MFPSMEDEAREVITQYLSPDHIVKKLGGGVNGIVFSTSRGSAVKIFQLREGYTQELRAYQRIDACGVWEVCGFTIPHLLKWSDNRLLIELSIVQPPYLLDFASCCIDKDPRDVHPPEWLDQYAERIEFLHEDRAPRVFEVYNALSRLTGIFHTDLRPTNIGFGNAEE